MADPLRVFSVSASDGKTGQVKEISYTSCRIIGNGSFGIVFYAKLVSSRPAQEVAIKRVLQDKRYKVFFSLPLEMGNSKMESGRI